MIEFKRIKQPFAGMQGWGGRSDTKQYVIAFDEKFSAWGYSVSYKPLDNGQPYGPPIHVKLNFPTKEAAVAHINSMEGETVK